MITLLLATRNAHKVEEIQALLNSAVPCLTLRDFPAAPAIIEDAPTFAGNAAKKAMDLARWLSALPGGELPFPLPSSLWVLADDSGLEVDALGGAPGVHSARFAAAGGAAEGNSPDSENNAKLLRLLGTVPADRRTARFRCVLALARVIAPTAATSGPREPELPVAFFSGCCEGSIGFTPRGAAGFGYDPLFLPHGQERSFAELGAIEKNRISHRSQALAALRDHLSHLLNPT